VCVCVCVCVCHSSPYFYQPQPLAALFVSVHACILCVGWEAGRWGNLYNVRIPIPLILAGHVHFISNKGDVCLRHQSGHSKTSSTAQPETRVTGQP